jgi:hypothetical protein
MSLEELHARQCNIATVRPASAVSGCDDREYRKEEHHRQLSDSPYFKRGPELERSHEQGIFQVCRMPDRPSSPANLL